MRAKFALAILLLATLACGLPIATPEPPTATPVLITETPTPQKATPATPTLFPDTPAPPVLSFPTVESPQFTALYMIDELDGWAVAEGFILRTNDGGASWYDVSMPGENSLGYGTPFSVLDAAEAWVLLMDSQDSTDVGKLYHTQDGGLNWEAMPVPFGSGSLEFLDENLGWMMENLGVGVGSMAVSIFQSGDGGLTWQQVYTNDPNLPEAGDSLPLGGLKNNLVALDLQTAWVGGVIYAPDTIYLHKTTDGGRTWAIQPLPSAAGTQNSEASTTGPIFLSENDAILPVRFMSKTSQTGFYVSHDGGQTWGFNAMLPGIGRGDFAPPSHGFYWNGEFFYTSEDSGQTWTQITPNVDFGDNLMMMDFVNAHTGWIVTFDEDGQKVLYKTVDGGANWVRLSP